MSKQFIGVLVVVVLALFGVFALTKKSTDNNSGSNSPSNSDQLSEHKTGAGKKGVTLIEYGDYQCPVCKSYYPLVKQVQKAYGDDITFQFRNFPLTQLHPHAFEAARAAEAASLQGKFWQMHDLLYENQDTWAQSSDPSSIFDTYAGQLGLDVNKFKTDQASEQVASVINADVKAALGLQANGTPTFVINGQKVETNPTDLASFKQLIDNAISGTQTNQ
ncbi:MAG TPA: thioredoxin domain-containing protein [Candidatus Saccharimonadales bacterium]|nr:thioredoxin domain-containing protein [Candidatus Saccharimonadales bacterium]